MSRAEPVESLEATFQRLVDNVIDAAAATRDVIDVGPFRVLISPDSDLIYYNYAVPLRPCENWSAVIPALCETFEARGRVPRLEYFGMLWPTLEAALEAAGFTLELAAPVMTLTPAELLEPASSLASILLLRADDDLATFTDFLTVGAEGFEVTLTESIELSMQRLRPQIANGSLIAALARVGGESVACGSLMCTGEVAELAGVATTPASRRQGIAADLCAVLLRKGFEAGITLSWLSAASAGARALYEGLGLTQVGAQMHYSRKL